MIWLLFAALMKIVTVIVAVRAIRETVCMKKGHAWDHTDAGVKCRRCRKEIFID